ncbi:Cytochrome c biogenesis ATP-binding export protein CcmA [Vibrio palustris]|uniref:Cytochrome c biogenesis ATP-binding export protein CcmA n=2 Tax=Vibrio palustris TaxID=1918946 RepID=A0A1R4B0G0_9VIBR|nr:Cytochrome c biogenesis ATP-binding export protein CcmA [Vibrio palustris]
MIMLTVQNLTVYRSDKRLFETLSFELKSGDILQITGRNGAGKTTLLRTVAGLNTAESGHVLWQGEPLSQCRDIYYRDMIFLGHVIGLKRELSAIENLIFYQTMQGNAQDVESLYAALAKVGLAGREDLPIGQLSAGQQRRVSLARLWLSQQALWILDEPFTSIDKQGIRVLEALFEQHAQQGGMILLTSHQDTTLAHSQLKRIELGESV